MASHDNYGVVSCTACTGMAILRLLIVTLFLYHATNSPFPLRHVDSRLIHQCLDPHPSLPQTPPQSLYTLPHSCTTKAPLVTIGRPKLKIHPQNCPSLRRSPPLSNTPIPRPTPLTTPNGIWIKSAVLPQYTLQTD